MKKLTLSFVKRNLPIFIIGFLTILVFIGVLIASMNSKEKPGMEKVANDTTAKEETQEKGSSKDKAITTTTESTESFKPIYKPYDFMDKKIEYTEKGFSPKSTYGFVGQKMVWQNKTNSPITIIQTTSFFDEFKAGVTISPGGTFEFTLRGKGLWTYEEKATHNFGSINIEIMKQP